LGQSKLEKMPQEGGCVCRRLCFLFLFARCMCRFFGGEARTHTSRAKSMQQPGVTGVPDVATGDNAGETESVNKLWGLRFQMKRRINSFHSLLGVRTIQTQTKAATMPFSELSLQRAAALTPNSTLHSNHHMPSAPPWSGQICCRLVLAITAPYRSLLVICLSEITPVAAGGRGKRVAGMRGTGRRSDTATLGASRLKRAATLSVLPVAGRTLSKRKAKQRDGVGDPPDGYPEPWKFQNGEHSHEPRLGVDGNQLGPGNHIPRSPWSRSRRRPASVETVSEPRSPVPGTLDATRPPLPTDSFPTPPQTSTPSAHTPSVGRSGTEHTHTRLTHHNPGRR
jgi:hypothetical protein